MSLPLNACINNEASTINLSSFLHIPSVVCSLGHTLPSSGFSQPQSSLRVCPLKPEFQHLAPAHTHRLCLRLGSAGRWHGPFVLVSLCSACCKVAAALSSEPLKLPFGPAGLPLEKGLARVREAFFFRSSLPGMQVLSPLLFFLFLSSYLAMWLSFLQFWFYEIICQHSAGIL